MSHLSMSSIFWQRYTLFSCQLHTYHFHVHKPAHDGFYYYRRIAQDSHQNPHKFQLQYVKILHYTINTRLQYLYDVIFCFTKSILNFKTFIITVSDSQPAKVNHMDLDSLHNQCHPCKLSNSSSNTVPCPFNSYISFKT